MNGNKILALLLALVMLFALAACGESGSVSEAAPKDGADKTAEEAQPATEPAAEPAVEPAAEPAAEPAVEPAVEPAAEPTLVGTWKCEKDLKELLASELGTSDPESVQLLEDFEQPIPLVMTLQFNEDGSCILTPDMSKAKEALFAFFCSYLDRMFKESGVTMDEGSIQGMAEQSIAGMDESFSPVEGSYEENEGLLYLGASAPVPYALDGDTLSISVEGFGELQFVRVVR